MKGVGVLWLVLALSACSPRDETQAAEQIAPIVAPIGCRAEAVPVFVIVIL